SFLRASFLCLLLRTPPSAQIHTLSLHDALPISPVRGVGHHLAAAGSPPALVARGRRDGGEELQLSVGHFGQAAALKSSAFTATRDRKSTRLNSSHVKISYAVFCLKKKKKKCTRR